MEILLPTNRKSFAVDITIETKKKQRIVLVAKDSMRKNTCYYHVKGWVDGKRVFQLKFPTSPKEMLLIIYNEANGNQPFSYDKTFKPTKLAFKNLTTCGGWLTAEQRSFVEFAQKFSAVAASCSAGGYNPRTGAIEPHTYRSKDGLFTLDYYDTIIDRKTRSRISTPARISHTTGIIEVSKAKFIKYTVPMRLLILLHEFSHNYMNPTYNRDVTDESGADFGALYIYLSLGYSQYEARKAFLHVFKTANNSENAKRYQMLDSFIQRFDEGKILPQCRVEKVAA